MSFEHTLSLLSFIFSISIENMEENEYVKKYNTKNYTTEENIMNEFTLETKILEQVNISREENIDLIKKAQTGDKVAMQKATLYNGKLVLKFIEKYRYLNDAREDLLQVGLIGITRAIQQFDVSRGAAFSTFAMVYIKQEIFRYLKHNYEFVAMPDHFSGIIMNIRIYIKKNGYMPSDEELLQQFDVSKEQLSFMKLFYLPKLSLCDNVHETMSVGEYLEQIPYENINDNIERKDLPECVNKLINKWLNEKDYQTIVMRFGLDGNSPHTQTEIGNIVGRSSCRIQQREAHALRRLRFGMRADKLNLQLYLR